MIPYLKDFYYDLHKCEIKIRENESFLDYMSSSDKAIIQTLKKYPILKEVFIKHHPPNNSFIHLEFCFFIRSEKILEYQNEILIKMRKEKLKIIRQ